MSNIKKYTKNSSKLDLAILTVFVLALAGAATFAIKNRNNAEVSQADAPTGEYTNLDPATENDKKDAEDNKQQIVNDEENNSDGNDLKQVEVVVSFAGPRNNAIDIRSYVQGVYESTGKCTLHLIKGDQTLTREVEGIKDATYTRCDRFVIPYGDFPEKGEWEFFVVYESPTAKGKSELSKVVVP